MYTNHIYIKTNNSELFLFIKLLAFEYFARQFTNYFELKKLNYINNLVQ